MNTRKPHKKLDYNTELFLLLNPKVKRARVDARWTNPQGQDCKKVIQTNRCFCQHVFEKHEQRGKESCCRVAECGCTGYEYVPFNDIRCMCKHSFKDHDQKTRMCKVCKNCLGFLTNWSCKCGFTFCQHKTVVWADKKPV